MVTANDRFLDQLLLGAAEARSARWAGDDHDPDERRVQLASMLGLHRDQRPGSPRLEHYHLGSGPIAESQHVTIHRVRWRTIGNLSGDGLLLVPKGGPDAVLADIVAIPDPDQLPEDIAGWGRPRGGSAPGSVAPGGSPVESPTTAFALRLAEAGCRVLVPALVDRTENEHRMTTREWLHRPAFGLGRHILGYELHQVLSGLDALLADRSDDDTNGEPRPAGVIGWGGGGLLALYAGALDPRFDAVAVSGYFGPREQLWTEPADHNIHGLLALFGDAEIGSLVAPRSLLIESGRGPDFVYRPGPDGQPEILEERTDRNGKPGRFANHTAAGVEAELGRLQDITGEDWSPLALQTPDDQPALGTGALAAFIDALGLGLAGTRVRPAEPLEIHPDRPGHDHAGERRARLVEAIRQHNQQALVDSARDREAYFSDLDTQSLETFSNTVEPYRERFRTEVIGDLDIDLLPPAPRTRRYQEGPHTISYEVVLDVAGDMIVYGLLTLPKDLDLAGGDRRPVVVCQHGLEGTPQDLVGEARHTAYLAFATRLAERGFVTFAPQNGYKYADLFRMQQFKAQSLGGTLFSLIVPQHRQLTGWLASLPFVDPDRIAFYGLSYGGKTAMRVPPLVDRYSAVICSADFNEWVWKNVATDARSLRWSYANKGEYEIFEWNLGGTFNYAEMAALICPRPFMVERGHYDGVAPDEMVAHEFAKVRRLYQARLGLGDRCEIEWFVGPHAIHGQGTYEFLHRHLDWLEEGGGSVNR